MLASTQDGPTAACTANHLLSYDNGISFALFTITVAASIDTATLCEAAGSMPPLSLRRRLQRARDVVLHKITRRRLRARATPLPEVRAEVFPSRDLLQRIALLEATHNLVVNCWAVPQLRRPRYWDRRRMWRTIDEMAQVEEALYWHMHALEDLFKTLSSAPASAPMMMFKESSLRLPGAYPTDKTRNSTPGPYPNCAPNLQPRAGVSSFLSGYYLMLREMREDVSRWRLALKAIADQV